jgi:hypothetical protein
LRPSLEWRIWWLSDGIGKRGPDDEMRGVRSGAYDGPIVTNFLFSDAWATLMNIQHNKQDDQNLFQEYECRMTCVRLLVTVHHSTRYVRYSAEEGMALIDVSNEFNASSCHKGPQCLKHQLKSSLFNSRRKRAAYLSTTSPSRTALNHVFQPLRRFPHRRDHYWSMSILSFSGGSKSAK